MKRMKQMITQNRWIKPVSTLVVIMIATAIFIGRNTDFFAMPNFFVEDATVLYNDVFTRNPIGAFLNAFNGYLIVGLYALAYIAAGLNALFGNGLVTLPVVTAIVSCLFLGLSASLPYMLFRRELGVKLAIALVILLALVPMYSYDYAIIGSLSNLKFIFFYIAFIFILYRYKTLRPWQYIAVDTTLLICVLTNATVAFLIPFILITHVVKWRQYIPIRLTWDNVGAYSALITTGLACMYVLAAVARGIPTLPGYMDEPFLLQSLLPVIDRSIFFAWFYPITTLINSYFVGVLLIITAVGLFLAFKKMPGERVAITLAIWALLISTALLIVTRSGLGQYYLTYVHKGGPDQFFVAQNMIVIFMTGWLFRGWINRLNTSGRLWLASCLVLYLTLAIPYGSSFGGSSIVYKEMRPIQFNLEKACREYADQPKVIIQVYPNTYWQWHIDKKLACN